MKTITYTLLLTGMAILPLTASAQTMTTKTTLATNSAQNISQADLNAIKGGALTNAGQPVPVETKVMMSTGNLDGYTVRKVQQSLSERGYYKGKVTGKWDNETAASVQSFQRASGDQVDESGKLISSGTLARLGVTLDKLTAGDANSEVSSNPDLSRETRGLAGSKMSPPGKTVPAPDNGPKSTLTRDAVASGQFNETIDGSHARGTTDGTAVQNNTTANNPTAGIAGTRSTPVNGSSVVGNSNLSAGTTSSASVQTTGSLQATAAPRTGSLSGGGTATNNVDGRTSPGSPPTSSSALGGRAAGSLSNSTSTAATGSASGIANSGGGLSDGAGSGTSGSSGLAGGGTSGASSGTGSLSGSGGGSAGGGSL
ncbi:MAG: putative peptidoglycan binding domain [Micavibrio sp.]|nr:putative peptidoglycan binding domain [Micavibrio sp.]